MLLERIRDIVFELDTDESGTISVSELEQGWGSPALRDLLKEMKLPKGFTAQELMFLLDRNGCEEIPFEDFITNIYRMLLNDAFQMNCCLHASLNEVKTEVKCLRAELKSEVVREVTVELGDIIDTCVRTSLAKYLDHLNPTVAREEAQLPVLSERSKSGPLILTSPKSHACASACGDLSDIHNNSKFPENPDELEAVSPRTPQVFVEPKISQM